VHPFLIPLLRHELNVKSRLQQGHGFFGGQLLPDLPERFLSLPGDLRLQLVDLTENEQEVGVDELPLPVVALGVDEFPGENGVLELPEAALRKIRRAERIRRVATRAWCTNSVSKSRCTPGSCSRSRWS
jgi:hypothetical protein